MKTLIVLTGMMGCGKTSTGKLLARVLKFNFIDVDTEIEKDEKKTITQIFNDKGEQYFRFLEKEKIEEYSKLKKTVLSLGGGAFEDEKTRELLMKNGIVIYLKTTPEAIFKRIHSEIHRPLLRKNFSVDTIAFILKKRVKNYKQAHHTIETTNKKRKDVVRKILGVLKW